ncbi:MAG TPA: gentisate 1,2-dioxygenase [Stellaceae bacterium]|jgi:gentisate 1,2-dioxygenase|nr:gentisate 1,2-dioxygenase [Stellaceae bacterium]
MNEAAITRTTERAAFYDELAPRHMAPLWEVLRGLITREPQTPCVPALWRYDEVRPYLMRSGALITAREAERRVLILENPALRGKAAITHTLYAGLQLILPGEVAPAHRHSQSALRFVLEGEDAYTAVDGERTYMSPGDFVITPSWTWHDHGNESDKPMVWLDGLDIPLVGFLDAGFMEPGNSETQMVTRPTGDSLARYGSGLLPVDWKPSSRTSPVFNYPYARTREALEQMKRQQAWDSSQGLKLRYVNPATGDHAMPTMATFMQLLPGGFAGAPYRSTDGTVYVCVEGSGETRIGDQRFAWGPRDVFVVPSWAPHAHRATAESVLFSFSDRAVQEKLGLWREVRGAA